MENLTKKQVFFCLNSWVHYKYKKYVWLCANHIDNGLKACSMKAVSEEKLKAAFVRSINKIIENKEAFIKTMMENINRVESCPVRDVLSRLGDKWTMLVLITLNAQGTMRFSDIQKSVNDISQRMLTVTLRSLESDGLVVRKVYAEVPPRVEYQLTAIGGSLIPHINSLIGWALDNMNGILEHRQRG